MSKPDDPIKKIFNKSADELFKPLTPSGKDNNSHAKAHSANAFCGFAGPEEIKHFYYLLAQLSDKELVQLSERVKLSFLGVTNDKVDRDTLESVLEETDRENFYREFHALLDARTKKRTSK